MTDSETRVAPPPVLSCNRQHMLLVVRALEAGDYHQGMGFLRRESDDGPRLDGETAYEDCCAGVASNVRVLSGGGGRWFRTVEEATTPQALTFTDLPPGQVLRDEDLDGVPDERKRQSTVVLTEGTVGWLGLVTGEAPDTGWETPDGDAVVALPVYVPEAVVPDDPEGVEGGEFRVGWHPAVNLNDAGVSFEFIARCLRFTYLRPDPIRQEARRAELARLTRPALAAMYRNSGYYLGSAHPLERWNKGEIVSSILEHEFYDAWQGGNYTPASQA